jgi:hypothetical protein
VVSGEGLGWAGDVGLGLNCIFIGGGDGIQLYFHLLVVLSANIFVSPVLIPYLVGGRRIRKAALGR